MLIWIGHALPLCVDFNPNLITNYTVGGWLDQSFAGPICSLWCRAPFMFDLCQVSRTREFNQSVSAFNNKHFILAVDLTYITSYWGIPVTKSLALVLKPNESKTNIYFQPRSDGNSDWTSVDLVALNWFGQFGQTQNRRNIIQWK